MDILSHVKCFAKKGFLENEDIDVKYINVDDFSASIDALPDILSKDEKQKVASLRKSIDKKQYHITRVVLRLLLSAYLNIEPRNIVFDYSKNGKPKVINRQGEEIYFNLSHSRNISVFAFSRKFALGIDLEHIDATRDNSHIVKNFFSKNEQKYLLSLDEKKRVSRFFKSWVTKEAYLKGSGLNLNELRKIEVEHIEKAIFLKHRITGEHLPDWSFLTFKPANDFIACLAFRPVSS